MKKTPALVLLGVLVALALGRTLGFDALALIGGVGAPQEMVQSQPMQTAQGSRNGARGQVCGALLTIDTPVEEALEAWGKSLGMGDLEAFANVLQYINQTGDLPDCYLKKNEARAKGWQRGTDLWRVAEGAAIGGNAFQNREGLLPRRYNGRYIEADLDYDGQRRDARRIVFVDDADGQWLIWITLDHYDSFLRVSP